MVSCVVVCSVVRVALGEGNLVGNSGLEQQIGKSASGFLMEGDVELRHLGDASHGGPWCFGLQAGKDLNGDGKREGAVSAVVEGLDGKVGRWYRFSVRGLPGENFRVEENGLWMKVEFFQGAAGFDGKVRRLYSVVEQQRKDFGVNGDRNVGGAATWHTYLMDVMLPSPLVDRVKLSVGFDHAVGKSESGGEFLVTDVSMVRIEGEVPKEAGEVVRSVEKPANLIPIGGRYYYKAEAGETKVPARIDYTNSERLIYDDGNWSAPFAGMMSAWLRAGDMDLAGDVVKEDKWIADNVVVTFDSKSMVIHTHALPNHPTGKFPGENPSYIQEKDAEYSIPLVPVVNPRHVATDKTNTNQALNMGPIGIAANGVVFFNPFDASSQDASNIMDYCCGHPAPDYTYHYHKYPICINSPWADEGKGHSPILGWAFDGFPIYGPYVKAGVMAKDASGADGLNEFNEHADKERGVHYQVTPGKFPYIIGGYWGVVDSRDVRMGRRGPG